MGSFSGECRLVGGGLVEWENGCRVECCGCR